jgi:hypothetical protein
VPQESPIFYTMVTERTVLGHKCVGGGTSKWFWMNKDGNPGCPLPSPEDALQNYTGGNLTVTGPKETASIFATYPAPYLSLNNGFLDQVGISGTPGRVPIFAFSLGTSAYCSDFGWNMELVLPWHPTQSLAACVG